MSPLQMHYIVLCGVALLCLSFPAFAAPVITIHSPQNTTYSSYDPILINASASQPVDWYRQSRSGKPVVMARNTTSYQSFIFGSRGLYSFTIFANNSNGTAQSSVNYSINHSSTVNVTSCGQLVTNNVTYLVQNNLSGEGSLCLEVFSRDFTLNLQKYTVEGAPAIFVDCFNGLVTNGSIISNDVGLYASGTKCRITNLTLNPVFTGIFLDSFSFGLLEDLNIFNATTGIDLNFNAHDLVMKNLTMVSNQPLSVGFFERNSYAVHTLENSSVTNFTYDFQFDTSDSNWYLKNNNRINISSVYPDSTIGSRVRFFRMHLMKVNVTDVLGNGKASSIEVADNGILPRTNEDESIYTFQSNPTGRMLIGTDENGSAQAYITERLIVLKTESPVSSEEFAFGPYNLTARSGTSVNQLIGVNLNLNSTFFANFTINTTTSSLPDCTIAQMLDLDNNGVVNSKDAQVILRYMVGKPVIVNSTKQCNALNFNPING